MTGVLWVAQPEAEQLGVFLLALGLLGGSALAAAAGWQRAAGPKTRVFVLVVLAALSGGYVIAGVLGLLLTGSAPEGFGFTVLWVGHLIGVVVGSTLYLLTLVEGLGALRDRDRALNGLQP